MRLRSWRALGTLALCSAVGASTLAATPALAADPVGWNNVKITEVRSSGGPDFVEIQNTGSTSVDVSGWKVVDNDPTHTPAVFASSKTLAAGEYLSFETESPALTGGFGLGTADSATIFTADGTTVDTQAWTSHRTPSWSLCYGAFATVQTATPGAANACPAPDGPPSDIKISEVRSNGGPDFVEIQNTGPKPVDISGWKVVDNDPTHTPAVFATNRVLGAGQYFSFETETPALTGGFGLGSADSATIFTAAGVQVDTYAWTSHRIPSYIRCGTDFVASTAATPGTANTCPSTPTEPAWKSVKINEVESNGDKVADWVELVNNGTAAVDISGWKIVDGDAGHAATPVVVPASTSLAAGGHYAIYTEVAQSPGFGLGAADSATLYLADGTTQVDTYAWTAHAATTYGRCPDGTGDFTTTTTSTRGTSNACSPIRINEVESKDPDGGHDWVELVNVSAAPVSVAGWTLKDNGDADAFTIPADTTVPGNGHLALDTFAFGLGGTDSARLFDGSTLIDSYSWTTEATTTYGRCKDGLGDFTTTVSGTKGTTNACPGLDTQPWDGSQTVRTADVADTWGADLSGLAFDPKNPDVLWGAQNKRGTLWKLKRDGQSWVPADGWTTGKDPKYTDGTGAPDTEGITVGPDGFLYAASERDNSASGVSRMSILRYDPSSTATSLTATHEWDVTAAINQAAGTTATPIGANLGLEGVTFVPDSFLTKNGFRDQTRNKVYDPADYANHGSGLYVVAVEETGHLYAFALDRSGTASSLVADIASGLPKLADVTFDPERQRLWAVADDTVDGQTSLLKLSAGAFVLGEAYDRPAGMANLNNEGFAIAARSQCVDGSKEVVWSDDGNTDKHSLRTGTLKCTPPAAQTVSFSSTAPTAPVVGQTYTPAATGADSGNPVVVTASGECTLLAGVVVFTHPGTCTVKAAQAASDGYVAGEATQVLTVAKAATSTAVSIQPASLTARVTVKSPGAGTPTGAVTFLVDGTSVGSADVSAGVATLEHTIPAGAQRTVEARYAGSDDYVSSTDRGSRQDPRITASLSGTRSSSGWYSSPVTVTFTCDTGSAPLTADCPAPVTLDQSGPDQVVKKTITATDGGEAGVTRADLDIDLDAPSVKITGIKADTLYVTTVLKPQCVGTDELSGVDSCTLSSSSSATRTTVTATATDRAGNTATTSVVYRTLAYKVSGAPYSLGKFTVRAGQAYHVAATVKSTQGTVSAPYLAGSAKYPKAFSDGRVRVRVPATARPGQTWKIRVVSGGQATILSLRITR